MEKRFLKRYLKANEAKRKEMVTEHFGLSFLKVATITMVYVLMAAFIVGGIFGIVHLIKLKTCAKSIEAYAEDCVADVSPISDTSNLLSGEERNKICTYAKENNKLIPIVFTAVDDSIEKIYDSSNISRNDCIMLVYCVKDKGYVVMASKEIVKYTKCFIGVDTNALTVNYRKQLTDCYRQCFTDDVVETYINFCEEVNEKLDIEHLYAMYCASCKTNCNGDLTVYIFGWILFCTIIFGGFATFWFEFLPDDISDLFYEAEETIENKRRKWIKAFEQQNKERLKEKKIQEDIEKRANEICNETKKDADYNVLIDGIIKKLEKVEVKQEPLITKQDILIKKVKRLYCIITSSNSTSLNAMLDKHKMYFIQLDSILEKLISNAEVYYTEFDTRVEHEVMTEIFDNYSEIITSLIEESAAVPMVDLLTDTRAIVGVAKMNGLIKTKTIKGAPLK